MGIFSSFFKPKEHSQGSYCDVDSRSDVHYIEGEEDIEDRITSAEERGDEVVYGKDDWNDATESQRFDDDMRQIEQGPSQ